MTCERYEAALGDYVDGTLRASEQPRDAVALEALEAHLTECASCRAVVADFRTMREATRTLERRLPPPEVWTRVAAGVGARGQRRLRLPSTLRWKELLAAAAVLVLLVGGWWFTWQRLASAPAPAVTAARPAPGPAPDPELVQDVETQLKLAEEHYVRAIAGLETIARADGSELDAQTAGVLQANLVVIDKAIGESRAALQVEPASDVAQQSLFEALRSKVTLLQDTIALINEMRKGNQEGAARIVSGLNQ
jgi:anti-sigma factor RsiW